MPRPADGWALIGSILSRTLATHATPSEAARSLGCELAALRRAAKRAGVPWPQREPGRPRST